jgi:secreted PhoX family phosphatase
MKLITHTRAAIAKKVTAAGLTILLSAPIAGASDDDFDGKDFGRLVERMLQQNSQKYFGFDKPLKDSAPATTGQYRTTSQKAIDQILLAKGLKVEYLTRDAANNTDMMAFYPATNPTHLFTCVEEAAITLSNGKLNPSVQRINLSTGAVETVVRGMSRCDGIRTTPWGTILATEESADGSAYEILNPLTTSEVTITARNACGAAATIATSTGSTNVIKRTALPCMAWEGLAVLPSGVVIAGDELRPGDSGTDTDGGAIFKFVPTTLRTATTPITDLSQSPLVGGSAFAMQVSCNDNNQGFGQGCEVGNAAWVSVTAATARVTARTNGATGYYRPEDLHQDPKFSDPDNAKAIRFCWTDTQNELAGSFGEVMCGIDEDPTTASATVRSVLVYRFVEGDEDFNQPDNLEFQPKTGNVYVIEDHPNGDIWACLPDGADRDLKSDGCVKMLSVKDTSAEPTGFIFDPTGTVVYVSIQHSADVGMPLFDGYQTDDILKITGFKVDFDHSDRR